MPEAPIFRSFEDCIKEIDKELFKRKGKWQLTALAWLDFDDVCQIIRLHIYEKWSKYDQNRPLAMWVNTVITNQIKNLIRNLYSNFSRPCIRCAAAEGEDLCKIYTKQCVACPIFKKWESSKLQAYNLKLPVTLENHTQEVYNAPSTHMNDLEMAEKLHEVMKGKLNQNDWKVYEALYVTELSDAEVIILMRYKGGEKQLKLVKRGLVEKVKLVLYSEESDIIHE